MTPTLLTLTFAVLWCGGPAARAEEPPRPNPLAPSLPGLSEEQENRLDGIINRFIDYDSGKLSGPDGRQAAAEFHKLGPEAIPALIRGLNRAAEIEYSCPAVTIAKKLSRLLRASRDVELLEFARENVGAGVKHSRHMGVIRQLRFECLLRKRAVLQSGETEIQAEPLPPDTGLSSHLEPHQRELRAMSISQLVEEAGKARGPRLKQVVMELGHHRGDKVLGALGAVASRSEGDIRQQARDLLFRQLSDSVKRALKERLKDDQAEVRAAAARVVASKGLHWESELIDLLADEEAAPRQAAHEALVQLARGPDFGPKADSDEAQRKEAQQKWRAWLAKPGER